MSNSAAENGDADSLLSVESVKPRPDTLTKLVKRLRALTLQLLPVEADPNSVSEPTSRIITPEVISAYMAAAGDFLEALPYCLLRARAEFMWDANHNPADYGEDYCRGIACEVLARRIVHKTAPDRLTAVMSARYRHVQIDGDESDLTSALEMAIDSHCTIFLSSSEAQDVVNALWAGDIVQKNNEDLDVDYVAYGEREHDGFWAHLDPSRLCVPRYQNIFRIIVWLFFLFVYSQAVRQPVERLADPTYNARLDEWEIILYILALSIFVEDAHKFFKLLQFVNYRAFTFWNVISVVTDSLLIAAFVLRMVGMKDGNAALGTTSFQVLSFVSPFIWMKLVTVFDGYKYVGMMQICVARMLQESGIFFALLSILALGFAQAMYALDAADGRTEPHADVVHALVQALLQSPDFERYSESLSGQLMYYLWNVVTAVILLNVLISLFSSAYEDVVDDAEAQYLAFFAGKTVGMVRAPDSYVYPAPFNLIEVFFVSPFEWCLDRKGYARLNRVVMSVIFFIPLTIIALFESTFKQQREEWARNWLHGMDQGAEDYPETRDPEVDDENGLKISKVLFTELIKVFPNTSMSSDTLLLNEIRDLRKKLDSVLQKVEGS
ncbi:calcium activated cation channel [Moniliophthora roreri MCA 2997]|uniref:Calcium activated cation channel n=1 Tax=Moniliophthora roreri (strain MCA 2997) TaxID=1381753 RepID=V2YTR1_MONRO|nr:calcium activated cation channel [Moniliophthora roreri MCA 2997]